jgi:hypothetical protein
MRNRVRVTYVFGLSPNGIGRRPACTEIGVLGPLHVCGPRGTIKLAGGKEQTLLGHLVARAGRGRRRG